MTILVASKGMDPAAWMAALQAADPARRIITLADWAGEPLDYVVAWNADPAVFPQFAGIKVLFSLGAGVDHLLAHADKLPDCPVVRIADPDLTHRMSEWVVLQALFHHRQGLALQADQKAAHWSNRPQAAAHEAQVGILGYGNLGRDAAAKLGMMGFQICAWSRSAKPDAPVPHYHGRDQLGEFLNASDILVNLLPLTEDTRHLVTYEMLAQLNRNPELNAPIYINAGRGATQDEAGILRALDDGTLAGASIDVFGTEPLSSDNPFWRHPKVIVTPHCAADSSPGPLSRYIMGQIDAFEAGQPLQNVVDFDRGY